MKIPTRAKEYLTVGRTLAELRAQDSEMWAAGFRKRRGGSGRAATITKEFYQWWDRTGQGNVSRQCTRQLSLRAQHRCVACGSAATPSTRTKDGYSQYCESHLIAQREYQRRRNKAKVRYLSAGSYQLTHA